MLIYPIYKIMKNLLILFFAAFLFLISCSKDDNVVPVPCFNDSYTGTYTGNITINNVTSAATLKLTKKACYEATMESAADIGDKNINSITPNGQNGYMGKLVIDGSAISMNLIGNTITIIANTKYSFVGNK